jgi:CBS domain-containing protein
VRDAAKIMVENNIRRLVVVEKSRLAGVMTLRDITRSIVNTMASYTEEKISVEEKGAIIEYQT